MAPLLSRPGRSHSRRHGIRILGVALVLILLLVGLNAIFLNRETARAVVTVPGATLVETTSGPLQVVDTGASAGPGGQRIPLVLIHGTAGNTIWWQPVLERLGSNRRVIAVDLLGHGGSSKPDSSYRIEDQASLVSQVLAHLDVDAVIAVGHSLGGLVAVAMAEGSPDLVRGMVLVSTSPDRSGRQAGLATRLAGWPVLGPLVWRLSPDAVGRRAVAQAFAPGATVEDRYLDGLREVTYPAWRRTAGRAEQFVRESPLPDRLDGAGLPLLVIFGELDRIYPAREALSAYAGLPGVKTVLEPQVGHSPQIEVPERFTRQLLRFAGQVDREARAEVRRPGARKERQKAGKRRSGAQKHRHRAGKTRAKARQGNRKAGSR